MRFEHPELLWWLVAIGPGLTAFLWWSWRTRRKLIAQFVQSRLLAHLTVGVSTARQKLRLALVVVAALLLVVVLARPQWGFDWEEVRQRGLDIVVALDTSKSMLAQDVAPNRLARAKLAVLDLLKQARTDRLGLVAFAGAAFLQCPLCVDDEAFRQCLEAIEVGVIPQGGTALAEAIVTALTAFKQSSDNYKVLVLFTDGEDHDGRALAAAKEAARAGLKIFTVGVGTPEGEVLQIRDSQGRIDYVRDPANQVVKSRLNEPLLRQIAEATGGFYVRLAGGDTMQLLYERGLAPLPKSTEAVKQVRRWHERFQWFLATAIVLLVVEMFVPERKRVVWTEEFREASSIAALGKAVALMLLLALPVPALASPGSARRLYQQRRYEAAYREYACLLRDKPRDLRLHFNAGAAAYQAGLFDKALEHLQAALATSDVQLLAWTYYNLGNTHFRLGEAEPDPRKRLQRWDRALTCYQSALKLDPKDPDAQANLQFVQQKIDELKRSLQPSPEAQLVKRQADEAVAQRQYQRALALMLQHLQKDPTTTNYADYIQRLQQIVDILAGQQP
jgi:Ca-activated chloride channel family protein